MRHAPPRFAPFARIAPCLAVACATALAPAADRAPSAADTDADRIAAPRLLWDSGGGLLALPLADVDVELTVTGVMAHGKLTQRFDNPTGEVIEAVYVFPMPDRAAVYRMEMRVGDRRIVAVVHEKEEARQDYDRAKQTGRKASLVDEHRPNLFSTSVANINPGETVRVTLEYYEEVDYRDGEFGLRFPLSFTPRYDPARGEEIAGVDDPFATGVGLPVVRLGVTLRPG
ncbi:MAG TPA: VIT domain-containing protein, partial [Candidatus Polarisedimenticolaceae bacterium]|nr:VIT domain-containing protein [Candidatus Polarisedimenticolaceae bacterium]